MASVGTERRISSSEVLQYTIPVQVLENVPTQRIRSSDSLSYPFIIRNMRPNKVAEIRPGGKRWVLIAPHGGYTPTEHLMFMRWEPDDYTPDPGSIPVQEGEGVMGISAVLAREIFKRSYNKKVVWSFHSSPYSFGQEGSQSIPTMWHPAIFGLPEFTGEETPYISSVDIRELTHKDRRSILGGIYNQHFGSFLTDHTLNGYFPGDKGTLNRLFAMDQVQVGLRGIRVPTMVNLEDVLGTPGFFGRFLQPLVASINQCADDLSEAFTDFNPGYVRQRIKEAFLGGGEPEDAVIQAVLGDITRTPNLLEKSERARRIQFLREKDYPDEFISYLAYISDRRLPDSGPVKQWKRGFAYTFALCQDRDSAQCFMAISTAVEDGPGGVVEGVLGAKLIRPANPFSRAQIETKKAIYQELIKSLNGWIPECRIKDICSNFRRIGTNCRLAGIGCPNDPEAWDEQHVRYLEAKLDRARSARTY